ncbi:peptidoglycan D,D-transpeptidase FtsI family protein [Hippea alviniae]|uniref:peptidoglycan D,D-transpeptidase FtsI family protein n=1 Tax=Hippea alviniae TaxID=1279027 RepID=UPI00138AEE00|nr:penicillin-binding protein 2 [Hippea alviniae]
MLKAFNIQIINNSYYKKLYIKSISRTITVSGYRGIIYDSKDRALTVNYPSYTLFVDPWYFNKLNELYRDNPKYQVRKQNFFEKLKKIAGIDKNQIEQILKRYPESRFIKLKKLTFKQYKELSESSSFIRAFGFIKRYSRFYPDGEFSAHIIGFCFKNGKGAEGLENYYNQYLAAPTLKESVALDAFRKLNTVILPHGTNIQISINEDIQDFVHKSLKETIDKFKAEKGSVIVMNPYDGSIIAMDSYPFYDNNHYWEYPYKDIKNRAVSDVFEPGSVFKLLTMSAALDSGIFKGNEIIYCEKGRWRVKNKIIHDVHRFKYLSFKNVFVFSSNIGSAKIALKLGKKIFYRYLYKFGLGQKTGIDTISESKGIVKDIFNVGDVDLANMAFGQGIGVTEIQLADMYSAIANGGFKVKPHFIEKMFNDNKVIFEFRPKRERILKPETVKKVREILRDVVIYGTGKKAQLKDYKTAGKTGTAQIAKKGKYQKEYVASFAGFAPFENPRFVVVVSIFNPKGSIYGGEVAAPLFAKIMEFALHYYGVKPDKND